MPLPRLRNRVDFAGGLGEDGDGNRRDQGRGREYWNWRALEGCVET